MVSAGNSADYLTIDLTFAKLVAPEELLSGKRLHNYGKSPFLIGKPRENRGKMVIYMENHNF